MNESLKKAKKSKNIHTLAEEYLNGWKRAKADYENLKKTYEKNIAEAVKFGNRELVQDILNVIDHFDMAIAQMPEKLKKDSWAKGMVQIQKSLREILKRYDVEKIATQNKPFDPVLHEAVGEQEGEEGIILKELQAGYMMEERVIRPARVIVGKAKEEN